MLGYEIGQERLAKSERGVPFECPSFVVGDLRQPKVAPPAQDGLFV
jgi:hypothetical protein